MNGPGVTDVDIAGLPGCLDYARGDAVDVGDVAHEPVGAAGVGGVALGEFA